MRARVVVGMLILALAALPVLAQPAATESVSAAGLSIATGVAYEEATLRVTGPNGYSLDQRFEGGSPIMVDLLAQGSFGRPGMSALKGNEVEIGRGLTDGLYRFEAIFLADGKKIDVHSGTFFVEGGLAISRDAKRADLGEVRDDLLLDAEHLADSQTVADNVDGLSYTEAYAAQDHIDIFDGANDGLTFLSLDSDTSGGSLINYMFTYNQNGVFKIGTSTNTGRPVPDVNLVNIDSSARVGIGTTTPQSTSRLHVRGATSGLMVLDEGDTGLQTWVGSFDDKFLIDSISGSIAVGILRSNGNFGIGTFTPEAKLHIQDNEPQILVNSTGTTAGRTLAYLKNNGDVRFFWENTNSGDIWQMSMLSTVLQMSSPTGVGKFRVRKSGGLQALNGSTEIMALNSTGDLTVKSVTQTSSRQEKSGFESVDGISVLDKVAGLPISEWSYKADNPSVRHLGPMSEDFHAAFGLGKTDKGLTSVDTSGVALAAIQGLNQKLEEKDARIGELEQRLLELEELVQALAEH